MTKYEIIYVIMSVLLATYFAIYIPFSFHRPYGSTENRGIPDNIKFEKHYNLLS